MRKGNIMGLIAYLDSIKARDPAPRSRWEVLLYPGVLALGLHRIAHALFRWRLFFLARFVNHLSRFLTAIDIYQCVTLGGTSPDNGVAGKRHPTLANGAIVGSGAQVLGPITVGERARIGANAVVTKDVAAGAVMVGIPARPVLVEAETYQRDFVPYGTPCREMSEASMTRFDALEREVAQLRAELRRQTGEQERDRA
jgi:serine O-acetyltransferase